MTIAYICDCCGKRVEGSREKMREMPAGWLAAVRDFASQTWPWATSIVACSPDCAAGAKDAVKKHAREALAQFEARVDATTLTWGGK